MDRLCLSGSRRTATISLGGISGDTVNALFHSCEYIVFDLDGFNLTYRRLNLEQL